ncbi:ClpP/crotonase-like domain-containing protein [Ilyonectria robusta]|uniref:ClpP/crotonase-like domain-containing protein n=1 Tax=Ilyonectria robusta TaxID=1079257 RepID=UPI001E8CB9CE|nr:ClpP/crotonase-like domain-containing protein [Ilyonectria robusta]KAH8658982.1 ClpP/crotonase-like domain-containing protein [Ilyonectria robusta]
MIPSWLSVSALAFLSTIAALQLPDYRGLKTSQKSGVLEITLHNRDSAINLWNEDFQSGLTDVVQKLQFDNETKVVVFKSDVPKFFCAHLDLLMPGVATIADRFVELMFNISNLPQVTIGVVEGRARGAGNEFLMALDMRFATTSETLFGQIEVATGLIPGGGGSQHLARLIGRGLAMEYILSSNDINAEEAQRIGWINKAFKSSKAMHSYVDGLTSRLRLFPSAALAAAKQSINRSVRPSLEDLRADGAAFSQRIADPVAQGLIGRALNISNNLSLGPVELNLGRDLPLMYQ